MSLIKQGLLRPILEQFLHLSIFRALSYFSTRFCSSRARLFDRPHWPPSLEQAIRGPPDTLFPLKPREKNILYTPLSLERPQSLFIGLIREGVEQIIQRFLAPRNIFGSRCLLVWKILTWHQSVKESNKRLWHKMRTSLMKTFVIYASRM